MGSSLLKGNRHILVFCGFILSACTSIDIPVATGGGIDPITTASIAPADNPIAAVNPHDWNTVRRAMSASLVRPRAGRSLHWENVETGSSGILVTKHVALQRQGGVCQAFSTSLHSISGISQFKGEACLLPNGRVSLRNLDIDEDVQEDISGL